MVTKQHLKKFRPLFIIVALHIFWFAGALIWKHIHNGDTDDYIYLAQNIKKGFYYSADASLPIDDFFLSKRTPLYSIILLLFYTFFGLNDWPVIVAQNIASIASCWMVLTLFLRLFPGKKLKWFYILFLVFYPAQMCFAAVMAPDIFMQFLLVLYFREIVLSLEKPGKASMARMGLWLLLATLLKPVMYPFLMLHVIYSLWYYVKTKAGLVILLGALPLMVMVCYGFWNKSRTGLYHISSVQSDNLLNANARSFLYFQYGQPYGDSILDAANLRVSRQIGLKAKYELLDIEAKKIIREHWVAYSLYHIKESGRFFVASGKFDLDIYTGLGTDQFHPEAPNFYTAFHANGFIGAWKYLRTYPLMPLLILIIAFNLLRIIGWFLFLYDKQYPFMLKFFSSIFILYFAFITGPVANTRYFLPVLLVMSGLSAAGFAGFMERRRGARIQSGFINTN
jgi:hypothetical protein